MGSSWWTGNRPERGCRNVSKVPLYACRLWFVRMPRPPEAGALKGLEQDVELHRTQFNLITEALNVKKVRHSGASCRALALNGQDPLQCSSLHRAEPTARWPSLSHRAPGNLATFASLHRSCQQCWVLE